MTARLATDAERTLDPLTEARCAWRTKLAAERKLDHLRKYARLTDGMKLEQRAALERLAQANKTLERVLGGAA